MLKRAAGGASSVPQPVSVCSAPRHCESTYNQWRTRSYCTCFVTCRPGHCCDPLIHDAELSPRGELQVAQLRERVGAAEWKDQVELVVVSPLTRAVATAVGGFGDLAVPIIAHPLLREQLDTLCDVGSELSDGFKSRFPQVDWALCEDGVGGADGADGAGPAAAWWYVAPDQPSNPRPGQALPDKEPRVVLDERIAQFKQWLAGQDAKVVAVVGHSSFFKRMQRSTLKMANGAIQPVDFDRSAVGFTANFA